ncbi:MAG: hypothetical protein ACYC0N_01350 [Carboxydocellales bacterium]
MKKLSINMQITWLGTVFLILLIFCPWMQPKAVSLLYVPTEMTGGMEDGIDDIINEIVEGYKIVPINRVKT